MAQWQDNNTLNLGISGEKVLHHSFFFCSKCLLVASFSKKKNHEKKNFFTANFGSEVAVFDTFLKRFSPKIPLTPELDHLTFVVLNLLFEDPHLDIGLEFSRKSGHVFPHISDNRAREVARSNHADLQRSFGRRRHDGRRSHW